MYEIHEHGDDHIHWRLLFSVVREEHRHSANNALLAHSPLRGAALELHIERDAAVSVRQTRTDKPEAVKEFRGQFLAPVGVLGEFDLACPEP